ncbi:UDP-4-amino-4,6-dideoxy-N-acetyl-beta-L-altrosamine transaminase [Niveispirillum lacus]|uniref:UDP-4-amino-4, 6-dideoxy-N-acetyl-beta-L-altrosamine transaminase n=1 Tax=Niveispirillum lacus TaxID=1981099 RepID=UPI001FE3C6AE|nr:UDP-4-amino-4,6-dideoxy-N-acetyl-beta-L-altrosamine transaminase [Niveispirillum lacus]
MTARFLPYGRQWIDEADIAAVEQVLRGDWLTQGPSVGWFERAFAEKVGARHAIACANATAALHLCMLALNLEPDDAVVVPSVTFLATANAVRYVGAQVAFADVDPQSGLMRRQDAEDAIRRAEARGWRVRAVIPVHLAGQTADMAGLSALARERALSIVEDAAHAVGTHLTGPDGQKVAVGACDRSDLACFSFHPVKTMATGEGGMVTTNDDALARRIRVAVSHGMTRDPAEFSDTLAATAASGQPNPWYYEMGEIGLNYRMTDLQAALGLSQLSKLDAFVRARQTLVDAYDMALAPLAPVLRPAAKVPGVSAGWHLYVALIDFAALGLDRAAVMGRLRQDGVGSQVHYIPVHTQPYYRRLYGDLTLPGAQSWYHHCLSLPLYPAMSMTDHDRVVATLTRLIKG